LQKIEDASQNQPVFTKFFTTWHESKGVEILMDITDSKEVKDVHDAAKKAAFSPFMETLTRIGYGVRGLIYFTIGLLTVQVALGTGGELATHQDAIARLANNRQV
jgi:hypothetical protein